MGMKLRNDGERLREEEVGQDRPHTDSVSGTAGSWYRKGEPKRTQEKSHRSSNDIVPLHNSIANGWITNAIALLLDLTAMRSV
jgi:hypothetical protein